jgi:hypothetical protein
MCLQDIQLGRQTYSEQKTITAGSSAVELVSASPNRIALIISAPASNGVGLGFTNQVSTSNGLQLPSTQSPIILNIRDHGDIVRRQWWVVAGTNGVSISTISTYLIEQKGTTNAN